MGVQSFILQLDWQSLSQCSHVEGWDVL